MERKAEKRAAKLGTRAEKSTLEKDTEAERKTFEEAVKLFLELMKDVPEEDYVKTIKEWRKRR